MREFGAVNHGVSEISAWEVLGVLAEFDQFGGASVELVEWDMMLDPGAIDEIWRRLRAHALIEAGDEDRAFGEATFRLTELGWATLHDPGGRLVDHDDASVEHPAAPRDHIAAELRRAQAGTAMDIAAIGEIRDGHEVVRYVVGEDTFGVRPGLAIPLEATVCQHLLAGRLPNAVPDTRTEECIRDLRLTRSARIGAYIGVPLSGADARLYILCCLAHEQRAHLSPHDVRFLRRVGASIVTELDRPLAPIG